jgi:hypothetical protein
MKLYSALLGILMGICGCAWAQDQDAERVVVPARNSTRPRRVEVTGRLGNITVKAYAGKEVVVEASRDTDRNKERHRDQTAEAAGMRRLDGGPQGLTVEEQDNVVSVRGGFRHSGPLTISVPADTSVKVHSLSGQIELEGVKGEFDLESMNGQITLNNVSGSVLVHTMNGAIKANLDTVDPAKPLSFSTMNGSIDVTLPADFKGNVKLKTDHGAIYSDFELGPGARSGTTVQPNGTPDGKFRVKVDSTVTGSINGGGAEASFKTYNGTIYLRKKK